MRVRAPLILTDPIHILVFAMEVAFVTAVVLILAIAAAQWIQRRFR